MSPGEATSEGTARGPLIRHVYEAKKISLRSSAQPLLGKSILSPSPDERSQTLKIPRHEISSPCSSAIVIASNEDLLTQILVKLPPKSLLRFQCVSKGWLSIISDPAFRRLHSRRYAAYADVAAMFLFRTETDKASQLNFIAFADEYVNLMGNIVSHLSNFFNGCSEIVGLHSCNGLLAVVFKLNGDRTEFVVYNPTTRRHRLIPRLNDVKRQRHFEALNIVFDPSKSDHYKLVYVWWRESVEEFFFEFEYFRLESRNRYGFSVYESENGIWRDSEDTVEWDYVFRPYFENGVLWNGDLHWISDWQYTICFDVDKVCCNLNTPFLPVPLGDGEFLYFGESGLSLYVIEINDPRALLFDVFEMAMDYSGWVFKFRIDLAPLTVLYPSMVRSIEALHPLDVWQCHFHMPCFFVDKKEKKARLVISLADKVILYDINDMVVSELLLETQFDGRDGFYQWKDCYQYMETLANV